MSAVPYTKAELKKFGQDLAQAYVEEWEAKKELAEIEQRMAARNKIIAQCDKNIANADKMIAEGGAQVINANKRLKELDAREKSLEERSNAVDAKKKALWVKCFLITFGQSLPEKASEIDQIFTAFAFSTSFEVQDRNQFTIKSVTPFIQYLNSHSEVTQLDFRAFMRINDVNSFMKGLSDRLQQKNKVTKIIFDGGLKSSITGKIAHITPVFSIPANQQHANASITQAMAKPTQPSTSPIQIPVASPKATKSTESKSDTLSDSESFSTSSDEEKSPPSSPERTNNIQKYSEIQPNVAIKKEDDPKKLNIVREKLKNLLCDGKPAIESVNQFLIKNPNSTYDDIVGFLRTLQTAGKLIKAK